MEDDHVFVMPTKRVHTAKDLATFRASQAHRELVGFLRALNEAVVRVPTTHEVALSPGVSAVLAMLDTLEAEAQAVPPLPTEDGRFGNKAFRTWHERLVERTPALLEPVLKHAQAAAVRRDPAGATAEVGAYLQDSFGNPQRIDYGTGHELAFVAFLLCLRAVRVFADNDREALVTRVFARYLQLCRFLQRRYNQEPAGSHGVWGLDDHQFVPFIWGSAQLIDSPNVEPSGILDPQLVQRYADTSLYLDCIRHIYAVKSGPFFEHSPDLYNISAAASWRKINSGMFRKYEDDVLAKWPVIQHFLFGSILRWPVEAVTVADTAITPSPSPAPPLPPSPATAANTH